MPQNVSGTVKRDLSMERLSKQFDSLGIESQAHYVLARMKMEGGGNHPDVQKAISLWTSNFRVAGRTAYVAASKGGSTPASNVANSLVLMVFTRAKVS